MVTMMNVVVRMMLPVMVVLVVPTVVVYLPVGTLCSDCCGIVTR